MIKLVVGIGKWQPDRMMQVTPITDDMGPLTKEVTKILNRAPEMYQQRLFEEAFNFDES